MKPWLVFGLGALLISPLTVLADPTATPTPTHVVNQVIDHFDNDTSYADAPDDRDAQWWVSSASVYTLAMASNLQGNNTACLKVTFNKPLGEEWAFVAAGNLTSSGNRCDFSTEQKLSLHILGTASVLLKFRDLNGNESSDSGIIAGGAEGLWRSVAWDYSSLDWRQCNSHLIKDIIIFILPGQTGSGLVALDNLTLGAGSPPPQAPTITATLTPTATVTPSITTTPTPGSQELIFCSIPGQPRSMTIGQPYGRNNSRKGGEMVLYGARDESTPYQVHTRYGVWISGMSSMPILDSGEYNFYKYYYPRWSWDGTKVVVQYGIGNPDDAIIICNADGSNPRSTGTGGFPCWTPADRILFAKNVGGSSQVWIMEADGSRQHMIYGTGNCVPSDCSPQDLLFSTNASGTSQIYRIRYDGSRLEQLTSAGNNKNGRYNQDFTKIVFETDRSGPNSIYQMDADGRNPTLVTTGMVDPFYIMTKPPLPTATATATQLPASQRLIDNFDNDASVTDAVAQRDGQWWVSNSSVFQLSIASMVGGNASPALRIDYDKTSGEEWAFAGIGNLTASGNCSDVTADDLLSIFVYGRGNLLFKFRDHRGHESADSGIILADTPDTWGMVTWDYGYVQWGDCDPRNIQDIMIFVEPGQSASGTLYIDNLSLGQSQPLSLITATLTPTPTRIKTITPTCTATRTPTINQSATRTPTRTRTATRTATVNRSTTRTPTRTRTATRTPSATSTPVRTLTHTPTATMMASNYQRRVVVARADSYIDSHGYLWSPDQAYSAAVGWGYVAGGFGNTFTDTISNTPDRRLFQSERWSPCVYKFDVPSPGTYYVKLLLAENYLGQGEIGGRVFDLAINGQTVLNRYDILVDTDGLSRYAVVKTFVVQVNSAGTYGNTIEIVSEKFNAIEISNEPTLTQPLNPVSGWDRLIDNLNNDGNLVDTASQRDGLWTANPAVYTLSTVSAILGNSTPCLKVIYNKPAGEEWACLALGSLEQPGNQSDFSRGTQLTIDAQGNAPLLLKFKDIHGNESGDSGVISFNHPADWGRVTWDYSSLTWNACDPQQISQILVFILPGASGNGTLYLDNVTMGLNAMQTNQIVQAACAEKTPAPAKSCTVISTPAGTLSATLTATQTALPCSPTATPAWTQASVNLAQGIEFRNNQVVAYPNPAKGRVTFAWKQSGAEKSRVELYSLAGERIAHLDAWLAGENRLVWRTENVPAGVYFYQVILTRQGREERLGIKKLAIVK